MNITNTDEVRYAPQKDGTYFPSAGYGNIPYRGSTPEEVRAHEALEGQLLHTQELINNALTRHAHYDDDCGDYLTAALQLSADLMDARLAGGSPALLDQFQELARTEEVDAEGIHHRGIDNFASDGIALEVWTLVHDLNPAGDTSPWSATSLKEGAE